MADETASGRPQLRRHHRQRHHHNNTTTTIIIPLLNRLRLAPVLLTLMTLNLLLVQQGHAATADVDRIGSYLSRHCHEISSFLKPACGSVNSPPCCTLFALVDTCRTTCDGSVSAFATRALSSLSSDPAVCSQIQMAGQQFCQFRNSPECQALQCLMTMVCFDSHASCSYEEPRAQASERTRRQHVSRAFALPEIAACESTNLVPFDEETAPLCPLPSVTKTCNASTLTFRTVDGACNNLAHPDWGRAFQPPQRYLRANYEDDTGMPKMTGRAGKPLKSPRYISRYVSPEASHVTEHSAMVMAWGQFIDHDFTGFPVLKDNGTDIKCCVEGLEVSMLAENGGPCFPITIDPKDDFFTSQQCMEFARSTPADDVDGNLLTPREQVNALTSFIDGSTVYGSTLDVNSQLRLPDGKLRVAANNMLPESQKKNCKIVDNATDYCLLAGDHRVNVFVGLGLFHTVFHREHNRLVEGLAKVNPQWDGERLYQEARKIVSALHQHITYVEYLPSFLNDLTLDSYRLRMGDFRYDPTVRPDMANVFSTAAFRFGHSQVPRMVKAGRDYIPLEDTLMRPHLVLTRFDEVAEGLAFESSEDVDRFFVEGLTDRMFEKKPTDRDGLDLVALNVQRGRDHGLPSYNEYRKFCRLPPVNAFNSSVFVQPNYLSHAYKEPDDIDVFIGGVTEVHLANSFVGPLFACIIGRQFHDLKFGDRFFYETASLREGFTHEQLYEIRMQTLSSVLCANSDVRFLQRDIMYLPNRLTNPLRLCSSFPRIDLSLWVSRT